MRGPSAYLTLRKSHRSLATRRAEEESRVEDSPTLLTRNHSPMDPVAGRLGGRCFGGRIRREYSYEPHDYSSDEEGSADYDIGKVRYAA